MMSSGRAERDGIGAPYAGPGVLNDNTNGYKGSAGMIEPRATETVSVTEIKVGDTVIDYNSHNVPVYRVVAESKRDDSNQGQWSLGFDQDRDVAGPGEEWCATISHGGRGVTDTDTIERVTDLDDWEMAEVARLRELDKLTDGRVVWQVARHVTNDGQRLVRFARSENFEKVRPGTVFLVQGRRVN